MAITAPGSVTGSEKPDPDAAKDRAQGKEDRPGFDLGGSKEAGTHGEDDGSPPGSTIIPGGPASPAPTNADTGRSGGDAGLAGGAARHPGGPIGGGREGEVTEASPGGVRPPQSESHDRSDHAGDGTDAA